MQKAKDYRSLNIQKEITENVTPNFEFWNNKLNLPKLPHMYQIQEIFIRNKEQITELLCNNNVVVKAEQLSQR